MELLRTLRPHQWVKNLFVLAPLVFAEHLAEEGPLIRAGIAFMLFSLLSGCVYLLNDLVDLESDRAHPVKRNRPLASGRLPVRDGKRALGFLLVGTGGGAFFLSTEFAAIALAYFVLNVGYSFSLKNVPFVDVVIIATGFILRLFAGATAIDVPLSVWLMGCTFLLAGYLALGKRKHELAVIGTDGASTRPVLARYSAVGIEWTMRALAVATSACYGAYVFLEKNPNPDITFAPRDLVWTLPCVVFGLWRFNRLALRTGSGKSPTDLMLTDVPFMLNLVVWSSLVFSVIYL